MYGHVSVVKGHVYPLSLADMLVITLLEKRRRSCLRLHPSILHCERELI